jgi:Amiloride-sensitive sodium channel
MSPKSDEISFRFFSSYMEENCVVACNMQLHIKTCECLPYFFYNTENVEVCDFTKIACMVNNRGEI